jgi:hypothetical protein
MKFGFAPTKTKVRVSVRPTLILGLGGTGQEVLSSTKRELIERFGSLPPFVKILALDSTGQVENQFELGEFLNLNPGGINSKVKAIKEGRYPNIAEWFSTDIALGDFSTGAAGLPMIGRLMYHFSHGKVKGKLEAIFRELTDDQMAETIEIWQNQLPFKVNFELERQHGAVVHIISSICGGSGAGMLMDVAADIHAISPVDVHVMAHLFMPETFSVGPAFQDMHAVNAYTTLKEIDYWQTNGGYRVQFLDDERIELASSSIQQIFFISGERGCSVDDIVDTLTRERIIQKVSQTLCALTVQPAGRRAWEYLIALHGSLLTHRNERGKLCCYCSLGIGERAVAQEKLNQSLVRQLQNICLCLVLINASINRGIEDSNAQNIALAQLMQKFIPHGDITQSITEIFRDSEVLLSDLRPPIIQQSPDFSMLERVRDTAAFTKMAQRQLKQFTSKVQQQVKSENQFTNKRPSEICSTAVEYIHREIANDGLQAGLTYAEQFVELCRTQRREALDNKAQKEVLLSAETYKLFSDACKSADYQALIETEQMLKDDVTAKCAVEFYESATAYYQSCAQYVENILSAMREKQSFLKAIQIQLNENIHQSEAEERLLQLACERLLEANDYLVPQTLTKIAPIFSEKLDSAAFAERFSAVCTEICYSYPIRIEQLLFEKDGHPTPEMTALEEDATPLVMVDRQLIGREFEKLCFLEGPIFMENSNTMNTTDNNAVHGYLPDAIFAFQLLAGLSASDLAGIPEYKRAYEKFVKKHQQNGRTLYGLVRDKRMMEKFPDLLVDDGGFTDDEIAIAAKAETFGVITKRLEEYVISLNGDSSVKEIILGKKRAEALSALKQQKMLKVVEQQTKQEALKLDDNQAVIMQVQVWRERIKDYLKQNPSLEIVERFLLERYLELLESYCHQLRL